MKEMKKKETASAAMRLFSALFLFLWGTGFLVIGIIGVSRGKINHGDWVSIGPDVTPQSNPGDFWGSIGVCFAFAIVGYVLSIRDLISYFRSR